MLNHEKAGQALFKRLYKKIPARIKCTALFLLILLMLVGVTEPLTHTYIIREGNKDLVVQATDKTTNEIVKLSGVKLADKDLVHRTASAFGPDLLQIYRAYSVHVEADGVIKDVILAYGDVSDALDMADVELGLEDFISVNPHDPITPDMEIVVNRVNYQERVVYEDIPYETEVTTTYLLGLGESRVESMGVPGKVKVVYRDRVVDGQVVETEKISTKIISLPKTEVVAKGISPKRPHSLIEPPADFKLNAAGVPVSYKRVITNAISTAYSAKMGSYTASGMRAYQGTVAVDPKVIPYGTHLYIASADGKYVYGYAIAADTGTAIRDGIIDIDLFFNSYEASCRWGKKKVNIYILD